MKTFKTFKQQLNEATMWDFIYRKNKGIFYRGVGKDGKGTGLGALGKGVYLTWERGMAQAFAKRQGAGGEVKEYKLKRSLKIVDVEADKDFADVKAEMGFGVKQFSNDPMFAGMLTMMLKDKGYDGAVSDDVATGIVIFDKKNVKEK
jgi:hypothetical protein